MDGSAYYEDPNELSHLVEWIEDILALDNIYYCRHKGIDSILDLKTAIKSGKPSRVRELINDY
jgi:hypothetical protein